MTRPARRGDARRWGRRIVITVVASLLLALASAPAEARDDHRARAAAIAQALRFVAWGPQSSPGADLRIAILGNAALSAALREACASLQPGGRRVTVVDVGSRRELLAARPAVVVLGALPTAEADVLVQSLARRGVVTMGDGDCPDNRLLLLNLRLAGSRYRVQANPLTAARTGVNLSGRLLRLAHIVN